MRYAIADNAKPQVKLLMVATLASLLLWIASWYLPLVGYVLYPLQLFATFVHEGSHVLAALLTGGSVQSLTVSPDTSGEVYSVGSGWFSQLFISSAGYVGTTAFGAALLAWIRYGFSSKRVLYFAAGMIGVLTVVFGVLAPIFNFFAASTLGGMAFTVLSGIALTTGLFCIARFANLKWANFAVAFLAVQCLLNASFSLLELTFIAGFTNMHSDAANMAAATGIPGIVWALIWIVASVFLISIGMRLYAVSKTTKTDTVFHD